MERIDDSSLSSADESNEEKGFVVSQSKRKVPVQEDIAKNAYGSDSDSDDESVGDIEAQIRALQDKKDKKIAANKNKRHKVHSLIFAQPPMSRSKIDKLEQIQDPVDRGLQRLLWELGCDFELLEHQFMGVRALAGVSDDFPGQDLAPDLSSKSSKHSYKKGLLQALLDAKPRTENMDRGLIFADDMGLGKTVQSSASIVVRNAIAHARGHQVKPTLICSPNEPVMNQWEEHLLTAGIDKNKIIRLVTKQSKPFASRGGTVVLCTRYDFWTEAKFVFESIPKKPGDSSKQRLSPLFPHVQDDLLDLLYNQYLYCNGRARNKYETFKNGKKLSVNEVVTNELEESSFWIQKSPMVFQTVVVDEAHLLKRLPTYWGLATGMIALHSERVLLLTGTPFNNNLQDMATLMTYVDPTHDSAIFDWWERAACYGGAAEVKMKLAKWASTYLVRREKDVIADKLPEKTFKKVKVAEPDLKEYEKYEKNIILALRRLFKESKGSKEFYSALKAMLAMACNCQLSLCHPLLPDQGRQLSVLFSPSRRAMKSVKNSLEKPHVCVCCTRMVMIKAKKRKKRRDTAAGDLDELESDGDYDEDDELTFRNEEVKDVPRSNQERGKGDVLLIPLKLCQFASDHDIRHFACESCIEDLEEQGKSCPMCEKLINRCSAVLADGGDTKGKVYCTEIFGGFRASAKLAKMLSDFKSDIPPEDKVLIVSFFKGSLDLLEAMFHDHEIEVARFDGDIKGYERQEVLNNFKSSKTCRILLMSVQTGGTGLNIVEANHVWFVERCWNPMVMQQCEDRCYRIKQEKPVDVRYYDVKLTIDEVLRFINESKASNAAIVLSDSVALSNPGMSFKDLSGFVGKAISALMKERTRVEARSAGEIMKDVFGRMPSKERPSFSPTSDTDDEERVATPSTTVLENSSRISSCESSSEEDVTDGKTTASSKLNCCSPGLDDKTGASLHNPLVIRDDEDTTDSEPIQPSIAVGTKEEKSGVSTDRSIPEMEFCDGCGKEVPINNMELHKVRCPNFSLGGHY